MCGGGSRDSDRLCGGQFLLDTGQDGVGRANGRVHAKFLEDGLVLRVVDAGDSARHAEACPRDLACDQVDLIIACRGDISTKDSADIADRVRVAAESHPEVNMAFVHVDTIESPHHYPELLNRLEG